MLEVGGATVGRTPRRRGVSWETGTRHRHRGEPARQTVIRVSLLRQDKIRLVYAPSAGVAFAMAKTPQHAALEEAVRIAGSASRLSLRIGMNQHAVDYWLKSHKRVPGDYVVLVERVTGIQRETLRPDLFIRG